MSLLLALAGAAAPTEGNAPGAVSGYSFSLIPGVATGNAGGAGNAPGAIVDYGYSVLPGAANGGASSESANYTSEITLNPKKYYIRRKGKILLFNSAQEADEFIEAEQKAEQAAQNKTSRSARKRARKNISVFTQVPFEQIDLSSIESLAERYGMSVNMPSLVMQQDWDRVVEIYHTAMQLQDEEDIEILLMA